LDFIFIVDNEPEFYSLLCSSAGSDFCT